MQLRYDEDFVESAVFLCAAGRLKSAPRQQIARFHREREALYSILDPDERNRRFFLLHLEWFREWGFEQTLQTAIDDFPILRSSLDILAIRHSRGKKDEGAELYVNESGARTGILSVGPERLGEELRSAAFLAHEFSHLQDMVDPAFAYKPRLELASAFVSQERLARERYRVLWDVSIDGRLVRSQRPAIATQEQRWRELSGAFSFWPEERQRQVFASIWNDPKPTHRRFEELVFDPRQMHPTERLQPGALCPLCGFPTFAWATPELWEERTVAAVRGEFPHWSPEQGACNRCYAIYRCRPSMEPMSV